MLNISNLAIKHKKVKRNKLCSIKLDCRKSGKKKEEEYSKINLFHKRFTKKRYNF